MASVDRSSHSRIQGRVRPILVNLVQKAADGRDDRRGARAVNQVETVTNPRKFDVPHW